MADLSEQLEEIEEQLERFIAFSNELSNKAAELEAVIEGLKEMGKVKPGTKLLVPFSSGIFFRAELKQADEFLVNVGNGVVVKQTLEETLGLLQKRLSEMNSHLKQTQDIIEQLMGLREGLEGKNVQGA